MKVATILFLFHRINAFVQCSCKWTIDWHDHEAIRH